jgi:hypothetical protein
MLQAIWARPSGRGSFNTNTPDPADPFQKVEAENLPEPDF